MLVKLIIAVNFTWIGFVAAISFMEAWLKFQAAGMTVKLGLSVGRLVFQALNRVELVCASLILGAIIFSKSSLFKSTEFTFFAIALSILLLETFWLLPILDKRANLIIQGQILQKSYHHFVFIFFEILKISSLLVYGLKLLKHTHL